VLLGVALLSTPAIASVVAGALGLSGIGAAAPVVPAAPIVAVAPASAGIGIPEPFVGPDPVGGGSSLDLLARLDGVTLLEQLARLTPGEIDAFVAGNPAALADLAARPPAAREVASWWARVPAESRAALSLDVPGVVGNLEGLPFGVRDAANRTFLAQTIAGIHAQLDAGVGRAMEDELRKRLVMLSSVERALETGSSGAERTLIALDVEGEGRAVIGIGALESADYVTFFVPGMYVGVTQQLVDWAGNAETSLLEQRAWLERLGIEGEVATVAWIGYHTPTVVSIGSLDVAYEGRAALTRSLQGLDAVREVTGLRSAGAAHEPFVTVVAHSYGSTAAMISLGHDDVAVDALVLVGSPGGPAKTVHDLKVAGGNVWVAAADSDPIPRTGVYGNQPLDEEFGAKVFSVKGMTDPVTGERLDDISGHVYYFWPGTTAVRNTALIAIDAGDLVSTDRVQRASAAR